MGWNNPQISDLVGAYRNVKRYARELDTIKRPDRVIAIMYNMRSSIKAYVHYYYELVENGLLSQDDFYKIMKGE